MFEFIYSYSEFASNFPLAVAAMIVMLLRHNSAAMRHRIWLLGLIALLLVPLSEPLLPIWTVSFAAARLDRTSNNGTERQATSESSGLTPFSFPSGRESILCALA